MAATHQQSRLAQTGQHAVHPVWTLAPSGTAPIPQAIKAPGRVYGTTAPPAGSDQFPHCASLALGHLRPGEHGNTAQDDPRASPGRLSYQQTSGLRSSPGRHCPDRPEAHMQLPCRPGPISAAMHAPRGPPAHRLVREGTMGRSVKRRNQCPILRLSHPTGRLDGTVRP